MGGRGTPWSTSSRLQLRASLCTCRSAFASVNWAQEHRTCPAQPIGSWGGLRRKEYLYTGAPYTVTGQANLRCSVCSNFCVFFFFFSFLVATVFTSNAREPGKDPSGHFQRIGSWLSGKQMSSLCGQPLAKPPRGCSCGGSPRSPSRGPRCGESPSRPGQARPGTGTIFGFRESVKLPKREKFPK